MRRERAEVSVLIIAVVRSMKGTPAEVGARRGVRSMARAVPRGSEREPMELARPMKDESKGV